MRAALALVGLLGLASCGRRAAGPEPRHDDDSRPIATAAAPAAVDAADAIAAGDGPRLDGCVRQPFAETLPIAEASGAVWLARDGGVVLVVADSGHDGDYLVIDDADGRILERGQLPLGGRGDDLEGLAADRDGTRIWAITSSGWLRAWTARPDGGFELVVAAYPIDDDDECPIDAVNCGRNFEGLCLGPTGAGGGCAGYAAAKATGDLICLVADGDRWRADPSRTVHATGPEALAACDIAPDGAVWTGDNLFGARLVRRLVGGEVTARASLGDGFPEAMALAPDGTLFRFSDTGGAPSRVTKYRCGAAAPR